MLRARVRLELAGDSLLALGLIGEDAAHCLRELGLPAPETALACAHDDETGLIVVRRIGTRARYSLIGNAEAVRAIYERMSPASRSGDVSQWRRADIEAGVPVVLPSTRELFVPQMLNLDACIISGS